MLIPKNTQLPTAASRVYYTVAENQPRVRVQGAAGRGAPGGRVHPHRRVLDRGAAAEPAEGLAGPGPLRGGSQRPDRRDGPGHDQRRWPGPRSTAPAACPTRRSPARRRGWRGCGFNNVALTLRVGKAVDQGMGRAISGGPPALTRSVRATSHHSERLPRAPQSQAIGIHGAGRSSRTCAPRSGRSAGSSRGCPSSPHRFPSRQSSGRPPAPGTRGPHRTQSTSASAGRSTHPRPARWGTTSPRVTVAGALHAPRPAAFIARTCHVYVRPETRSAGGSHAVPPTRAWNRPGTLAVTSFTRTS